MNFRPRTILNIPLLSLITPLFFDAFRFEKQTWSECFKIILLQWEWSCFAASIIWPSPRLLGLWGCQCKRVSWHSNPVPNDDDVIFTCCKTAQPFVGENPENLGSRRTAPLDFSRGLRNIVLDVSGRSAAGDEILWSFRNRIASHDNSINHSKDKTQKKGDGVILPEHSLLSWKWKGSNVTWTTHNGTIEGGWGGKLPSGHFRFPSSPRHSREAGRGWITRPREPGNVSRFEGFKKFWRKLFGGTIFNSTSFVWDTKMS